MGANTIIDLKSAYLQLHVAAILRLKLQKNTETGELVFRRSNQIPPLVDELCKWELFSTCEKLVGHYPVAGWLRVTCSYVKRQA